MLRGQSRGVLAFGFPSRDLGARRFFVPAGEFSTLCFPLFRGQPRGLLALGCPLRALDTRRFCLPSQFSTLRLPLFSGQPIGRLAFSFPTLLLLLCGARAFGITQDPAGISQR